MSEAEQVATDRAWREYFHERTDATRNAVAVHYIHFAAVMAGQQADRLPLRGVMSADDARSVGYIGLLEAIATYNPTLGVKFTTHATRRIRGAVLDEARNVDWVPRITRWREKTGQLADPPPTMVSDWVSPDSHGDDGSLLSFIRDPKADDPTIAIEQRDALTWLLVGLDRDSRIMLTMRYRDDLTMNEIGQAIGVHESRVSQVITLARTTLRKRLTARGITLAPQALPDGNVIDHGEQSEGIVPA